MSHKNAIGQISPGSVITQATGVYGQNIYVPRNATPTVISPGGTVLTAAAGFVSPNQAIQTTDITGLATRNVITGTTGGSTTTPTTTTSTVSTAGVQGTSAKSPVVVVLKADLKIASFVAPQDLQMGTLRNGKCFSPSRTGPARRGRQDSAKRKASTSPQRERSRSSSGAERQPSKKRGSCSEEIFASPVLQRSASMSNVSQTEQGQGVNLQTMINASIDAKMNSFMDQMRDIVNNGVANMRTENDKIITELKSESDKCILGIKKLNESVEANERMIVSTKSDLVRAERKIDSNKTEVANKIKSLDDKMLQQNEAHSKTLADLRVEFEQKIIDVSRSSHSDTVTSEKKTRTVIAYNVILQEGRQPLEVARAIINGALQIKATVVNAEIIRAYAEDVCTLQIELSTHEEYQTVMDQKKKLRYCANQDIANIFITQVKTEEQRLMEHNCSVLMRELKLNGWLRQTAQGRLVKVKPASRRQGQDTNNEASETTATQTGTEQQQRIMVTNSTDAQVQRDDNSDYGDGRGRGHSRG